MDAGSRKQEALLTKLLTSRAERRGVRAWRTGRGGGLSVRAGRVGLVVGVVGLMVGGCAGYERRPLDLEGARAAWVGRSPGDATVREFAAALRRAEVGAEAGAGFDVSDGLTLAEAEAVALVFNAELRLARLEAQVTRASAEHAGLWHDPVLGVDLERIVKGAGGANVWVASSTISMTVPISGRLEAEKARAGAQLAAELDRVAAREWATRAALRELWVEWSAARVRVELGREVLGRLREVGAVARRQEQAGSMTRVEARVFDVEIAGREVDLIEAAGRERELELQVRGMLGLSPEVALTLVPSVVFAARTTGEGELRAMLEASSPELAAVRAEYEVAEQALRTEVRKQYPDLVVGPGYGRDQGDDRVLLGVSLPLALWNRNQQGVAEASAQREVARGRFEATYERLAGRLAIALSGYEAGRAQRALAEATLVPLADEQEGDVRRVAALGRVDLLVLLESLKMQHAAKVRLVDARARESIGAVRVEELIGPSTARPTGAR